MHDLLKRGSCPPPTLAPASPSLNRKDPQAASFPPGPAAPEGRRGPRSEGVCAWPAGEMQSGPPVWKGPRARALGRLAGGATAQTPESLLDLVLEDAHAYLEALERRKGSLLDAPAFLARPGSPGGSRREGPVRLRLDLAGFSPEDVAVQLEGRKLRVTARREARSRAPDGCCARDYREVCREALLPDDADLEAVACVLDAGGQLRVEAPRLPPPPPPERVVPIRRVGEAVGTGRNGEGAAGAAEKKPQEDK